MLYTMAETHLGGESTLKKRLLKVRRHEPPGEDRSCNASNVMVSAMPHGTCDWGLQPMETEQQRIQRGKGNTRNYRCAPGDSEAIHRSRLAPDPENVEPIALPKLSESPLWTPGGRA